jgi:hypothetical protein
MSIEHKINSIEERIHSLDDAIANLRKILEPAQCQHERGDNMRIVSAYKEDVAYYECKLCGEFYR